MNLINSISNLSSNRTILNNINKDQINQLQGINNYEKDLSINSVNNNKLIKEKNVDNNKTQYSLSLNIFDDRMILSNGVEEIFVKDLDDKIIDKIQRNKITNRNPYNQQMLSFNSSVHALNIMI